MSDNQDEEIRSERSRSRDRNDDVDKDRNERNNSREQRNDLQQQQTNVDADQVTNLYVRNLHPETTEESLREAFTVYGEITNASIVKEPFTLASRGFGFVAFRHLEHAEAALEAMTNGGAKVDGRTVKIEKARRSTCYDKTPGRYLGPPGVSMKHSTQLPSFRDDYRFPARGGFRRGNSRDRDRDYRGSGGDGFLPPPHDHPPPFRYPPRDVRDDNRFAPAPMRGDSNDYRDDPRGYGSRSGDPRDVEFPPQVYRGGGVPPMTAGAPGGHYRDDPRDNYPPRGSYAGNGGSGYRGVPPMAAGGRGGFRDERMYDRDYIRPLPRVGAGHPAEHPPHAALAYDHHTRGGERNAVGGGYDSRDWSDRDRDYPTRTLPAAAHSGSYDRYAAADTGAPRARSTDRPPYRRNGDDRDRY